MWPYNISVVANENESHSIFKKRITENSSKESKLIVSNISKNFSNTKILADYLIEFQSSILTKW